MKLEDIVHAIGVMHWLSEVHDDPSPRLENAIRFVIDALEYWEELLEEDQ